MPQAMIPVRKKTKERFKDLQFPSYVTTYEAKINFVCDYFHKIKKE